MAERRTLGLALAFREWQPAHLTEAQRAAVERQIEEWMRALERAKEQAIGFALAWLLRQTFAEGDDFPAEFDVAVTNYPNGLDPIVQWIDTNAYTAWLPMSSEPSEQLLETYKLQQMAWGSELIKGQLKNWGSTINAIIGDAAEQGLSRDMIAARLQSIGVSEELLPKWRSRLIAQTESIRNFNRTARGQMEVLATEGGNQYVRWLDGQAGACASCLRLHDQIIPLRSHGTQAYFADTLRGFVVEHPPLHPGCRCTIVSATKEEFDAQENYDDVRFVDADAVYGESGGIGGKAAEELFSPLPLKALPKPQTLLSQLMALTDANGGSILSAWADFKKANDAQTVLDVGALIEKLLKELGLPPGTSMAALLVEATNQWKAQLGSKPSLVDEALAYIQKHFPPGSQFPASVDGSLIYDFAKQMGVDVYDVAQALKATGKTWAQHVSDQVMKPFSLQVGAGKSLLDELEEMLGGKDATYDTVMDAFITKLGGSFIYEPAGKAIAEKLLAETGKTTLAAALNQAALQIATKQLTAKPKPVLKVETGGVSFPAPVHAEDFENWYLNHGQGKTGVAVFHAYSKATGKTMNQIKSEIEAEGYTVPQIIDLVKTGETLASVAPKVVPPKKKPAPKPPGTAQVKIEKDPTFKTEFTPNGMPDPDDIYWSQLTKTGPQMGSNPGGVYTGPDGRQYYLKQYTRNPSQAVAEKASHAIHDLLGIGYPQSRIITIGGTQYYASAMMTNLRQLTAAEWRKIFKANPELAAKLHVAASLTANWDVVGKTFDNLLWDDVAKKPVVIDAGGTFQFRAQGGIKTFGATAPDFDTLLDKSVNKNAASIFGDIYDDPKAIAAGLQAAQHLKDMLPYYTTNLTPYLGIPLDVLSGRLDDIVQKLTIKQPVEKLKKGIKPNWVGQDDYDAIGKAVPEVARSHAGGSEAAKREFATRWGSSSQSDPAMVAKAHLWADIYGMTPLEAFLWEARRMHGAQFDEAQARYTWSRIEGTIAPEDVRAIWEENQAILRKKHPSGFVTLYRGTGHHDEEIARLRRELNEGGTGKWYASPLTSFSTNYNTAKNFGGGEIIIKIKVPIEMVYATARWLREHGNHYNEQEYILITGPEGMTLTADQVEFRTRYAEEEPEYNPDGYVFVWEPKDDVLWHRYLQRSSKQDGRT